MSAADDKRQPSSTPSEVAAPDTPPAFRPKRSGSELRQRKAMLPPVRCTEEQRGAVEKAASAGGLTLGSYILKVLLKVPAHPAGQVPVGHSVDRVMLAQLLAQVGKIGSNTNQIAKALNMAQPVTAEEFRQLAAGIASLRTAILAALGKGGNDHQG